MACMTVWHEQALSNQKRTFFLIGSPPFGIVQNKFGVGLSMQQKNHHHQSRYLLVSMIGTLTPLFNHFEKGAFMRMLCLLVLFLILHMRLLGINWSQVASVAHCGYDDIKVEPSLPPPVSGAPTSSMSTALPTSTSTLHRWRGVPPLVWVSHWGWGPRPPLDSP